MRRVGDIDKVKAIEELLRGFNGTHERKVSGHQGHYHEMGADGPSKMNIVSLSIPVQLVATMEYDYRTGKGAVKIKDDNLGRICTRIPDLMGLLSELIEKPNGS